MTIEIINTASDDPKYSKTIRSAQVSMVPRIGDRIQVGYVPAPVVTEVLWDYDANRVLVEVK